jgi:hypothetical protein
MRQVIEPTLTSIMHNRLDHDLWANLIWIELIDSFTSPIAKKKIEELIKKQEEMLQMCFEKYERTLGDLKTRVKKNCSAWKNLLETKDLMSVIELTDCCTGQKGIYTLYDIVNNICLHGTYYRGALGLLASQESWPEEKVPNTGPFRFINTHQ